jgi:hypothetical protein
VRTLLSGFFLTKPKTSVPRSDAVFDVDVSTNDVFIDPSSDDREVADEDFDFIPSGTAVKIWLDDFTLVFLKGITLVILELPTAVSDVTLFSSQEEVLSETSSKERVTEDAFLDFIPPITSST